MGHSPDLGPQQRSPRMAVALLLRDVTQVHESYANYNTR